MRGRVTPIVDDGKTIPPLGLAIGESVPPRASVEATGRGRDKFFRESGKTPPILGGMVYSMAQENPPSGGC